MGGSGAVDVQQLYGEIWADDAEIAAVLGESLAPRSAEMLYDAFAALGVRPGDLVLDVGSRDAAYAVELVRRFGCRVLAVDPIPRHVREGRERVAREDLTERVTVVEGGIEAIPAADRSAADVWCRDVLNHVDLAAGLRECARVLRPGGGMLVYQTFATPELAAAEADRLYRSMAIRAENMDPAAFERTAASVGFVIEARDLVRGEWRERWAEAGSRALLDDLLAVARLGRDEERLVARFGRAAVEAARGDRLWGIYQMLGKLCPTVYRLRLPAGVSAPGEAPR